MGLKYGFFQVTLPLDTTVVGDVCVCVYHARQQLGRVHSVPVLSLHFHTGFLSPNQHAIKFTRLVDNCVKTKIYFEK